MVEKQHRRPSRDPAARDPEVKAKATVDVSKIDFDFGAVGALAAKK